MENKIKQKWLRALRSGRYKQAKQTLFDKETGAYCCLGVLAKVQKLPVVDKQTGMGQPSYKRIESILGDFELMKDLANRNDGVGYRRYSFKRLADYIEKNI